MPISKHFSGHGEKVAASMKKTYGSDWERVFYATENARKKHRIAKAVSGAKNKSRTGA